MRIVVRGSAPLRILILALGEYVDEDAHLPLDLIRCCHVLVSSAVAISGWSFAR
ncbi:hypothetical protein NUJ30_08195 [Burkholderia contaminans]|uniref:hypothetical protein n=1 Tax=Burkholderia TaxID=32008 RepID=UPI001485BBCF|nr:MULTISPECIES: hypothetical protein [Burkholderia]MBD1412905.1 hypothetical protein [Burkholderia contaminans]UXZ68647.1 hypothetical protein NUJ29_08200 [Burkholderia contaminans]UXZ76408.1 hypothetical protein NUJ30_08195 [Burkholderia contaminans]